ncbi:hypothetical protein Lser_V15G30188 [Lactuca serriola]
MFPPVELEESIKKTGGYPGRSEKEPPSTLMWTMFYLAQVCRTTVPPPFSIQISVEFQCC